MGRQFALLWYDPLFCEHARCHSVVLGPSWGKGPFFSLSLSFLCSLGLGCYVTLAPSECPQDIQPQSLP